MRPCSLPAALSAVRPWRTRINTPAAPRGSVHHTATRRRADGQVEPSLVPERGASRALAEPRPAPDPHAERHPDRLQQERPGAALHRRQRRVPEVRSRRTATRTRRVSVHAPSNTRCRKVPIGNPSRSRRTGLRPAVTTITAASRSTLKTSGVHHTGPRRTARRGRAARCRRSGAGSRSAGRGTRTTPSSTAVETNQRNTNRGQLTGCTVTTRRRRLHPGPVHQ